MWQASPHIFWINDGVRKRKKICAISRGSMAAIYGSAAISQAAMVIRMNLAGCVKRL